MSQASEDGQDYPVQGSSKHGSSETLPRMWGSSGTELLQGEKRLRWLLLARLWQWG